MNQSLIEKYAQVLNDARLAKQEIESLFHNGEKFTVKDAYEIQKKGISLREDEGDKIIGYKMGLTSKAKMEQMNLHTPIYGVLTQSMLIEKPEFNFSKLIHPKIEPEIAFITSQEISKPLEMCNISNYISHLCPALEILDSRFKGFKYFTLEDVIADNASSSHFYFGEKTAISNLTSVIPRIETLCLEFYENNEVKHKENLSAILDHPFLSLVELSKMFALEKRVIPVGSFILAGAVTPALPLINQNTYKNSIHQIGTAQLKVHQ